MSLISLMSAKGAPGVTTTAMLVATLWPRETILVDADPLGGDIALRLLSEGGHPLDADRGLMSLLPAARRGMLPEIIRQNTQNVVGGQPVVGGLPGPEQALAVAPLWPTLASAFGRVIDADVIADVGQLHARSTHLSMLENSSALIAVFRPTAWSAVHTRRRLEGLSSLLGERGALAGIVCVTDERRKPDAVAAADMIRYDLPWLRDFGQISWDPRAVTMFEGGTVHRPERTLLARSGRLLVERLDAELAAHLHTLSGGTGDPGSDMASPRRGSSAPALDETVVSPR